MKQFTKLTLSITLFTILAITPSIAQKNQNEFTSIFNKKSDKEVQHGGYGAVSIGYTNIDAKDAIISGVRGAWVVNHHIALGFAGFGFINNLDKSNNPSDYFLAGGYGGFFFEPIAFPNSPVHVSFPMVIGGGGISTIPNNYWENDLDIYYDYDVFFVFEPGVELEINMVDFFRIGLGTSYRFTNGILLTYPNDKQISKKALDGFNFYINFKFGKF